MLINQVHKKNLTFKSILLSNPVDIIYCSVKDIDRFFHEKKSVKLPSINHSVVVEVVVSISSSYSA